MKRLKYQSQCFQLMSRGNTFLSPYYMLWNSLLYSLSAHNIPARQALLSAF